MKSRAFFSGTSVAAVILFAVMLLFSVAVVEASKDVSQTSSGSSQNIPQEGQSLKGILFQNQQMSTVKNSDALFGKPLKIYGSSLVEDEDCGCNTEEEVK